MNTNEIIVQKSFEERMKDRIKESIGELISDEELSKLVEKGIQMSFFEKRLEKDEYGYSKEIEPFIIEVLRPILKEKVNEIIIKYCADNSEKIIEDINKIIKDGLGAIIFQSLNDVFLNNLRSFRNDVSNHLSSIFNR